MPVPDPRLKAGRWKKAAHRSPYCLGMAGLDAPWQSSTPEQPGPHPPCGSACPIAGVLHLVQHQQITVQRLRALPQRADSGRRTTATMPWGERVSLMLSAIPRAGGRRRPPLRNPRSGIAARATLPPVKWFPPARRFLTASSTVLIPLQRKAGSGAPFLILTRVPVYGGVLRACDRADRKAVFPFLAAFSYYYTASALYAPSRAEYFAKAVKEITKSPEHQLGLIFAITLTSPGLWPSRPGRQRRPHRSRPGRPGSCG